MLNRRLIAMICGTAACALAIGDVMQSVSPARQAGTHTTVAELQLDNITLTSAQPTIAALAEARPTPSRAEPDLATPACPVSALATAAPLASAKVVLSAPCFPVGRVTVHHNGMMFTQTTDAAGVLSLTVPALAEEAVFVFELGNGTGAVASARIPDIAEVDRVALQWSGEAGFEIHALEFGASYGQHGHVWSGGGTGVASQVQRFGDANQPMARMAEVYTLVRNAGAAAADGRVALSIEAEVKPENCGRDVSAQALELRQTRGLRIRDLLLAMPNCDAMGDFLVLNNLVADLKIASR